MTKNGKDEIDVNRRKLLFGFMGKLRGGPEAAPMASASQTAPVLAAANAAFAAGTWETAAEQYRAFLGAESDNMEARQRLGECLYRQERYIQAKVEFERILQKNRANNRAILFLGLVLARLDRAPKAAVVWKLFFDPHNVALQRELNLQIALVEAANEAATEVASAEGAESEARAGLPGGVQMAEAVERALAAQNPVQA